MITNPEHGQQRILTIGEGFEAFDREKLGATLIRLVPSLHGEFCIGGGVATQAQISAYTNTPTRKFNDIDLILHRPQDINPTVRDNFCIWHWHPSDPVDEFYVALVDKHTGVKIDIFGWQRFPPEPETAYLEDHPVNVRSSADLLVVFISAMYRRVNHGMPMIRKQLADALPLFSIANIHSVEGLWQSLHPDSSVTAVAAFNAVRQYSTENPDCFQEKSTTSALPGICHDCVHDELYSLSLLEDVWHALQK